MSLSHKPLNTLVRGRLLPLVLAFLAGALTVTAFAPFSFTPLALFGPLLLLLLWWQADPRQGFWRGYLFGLGLLGFGVFWMHISIDQFGNIGLPGAIALTLIFAVVLSLFYGLVGWLVARFSGNRYGLLFWVPALWVLGEWLRGWILGGFPWLALGYSQVDTPLAGWAPVLGVYGLSWLILLGAGTLLLGIQKPQGRGLLWFTVVPIILGIGFLLQQLDWGEPAGEPFQVSMIQGNVPQIDKWKPEQLKPTLELYWGETRKHWDSDLIIWPETAVPAYAHVVEKSLLKPLALEAKRQNSQVLMGIPIWRSTDRTYYNGLLQLKSGTIGGQYLKRHLVPFGEFMPLDAWLRPILTWMKIPMSAFTPGAQDQPLLELAGYKAGLSICYEDAFGDEVSDALPDAAFLVNVSNDAWFGDSLAPYQHLEIARMRALETGRYLLRSTNTGISALIDHKGRITGFSPPFEKHVLSGKVEPRQGATPFVVWGNGFLIGMMLISALGFYRYQSRAGTKLS